MGDVSGKRCRALLASAGRAGCDAMLVSKGENVRYLSGFAGEDSWLVVSARKRLLITDSRFTQEAGRSCPGWTVHTRKGRMTREAGGIIRSLGVRTGYEAAHVPVAVGRSLAQSVGRRGALVATQGLVEALRLTKDDAELAAIRKAARAARRGFMRALAELKEDASENDFAAAVDYFCRLEGGEGPAFPTIAAREPHSSLPHARPTAQRLCGSATFLADWGTRVGGYNCDLTRVVARGKVSPRIRDIWKAARAAQKAALRALRAGAAAAGVDAAARRVIADAGYGEFFAHGVGHGVGLEVHEGPTLSATATGRLRAGMVVTVEPGVYLAGVGGVRIEDMVLVRPGGAEILTHVERDPFALGRRVPRGRR